MKTSHTIIFLMVVLTGTLLMITNSCSEKTKMQESVIDVDGNVYATIKIGNQVWMIENLKTTKYNDGSPIPLVTDKYDWKELSTPAYCWYKNDSSSSSNNFGILYNWFAVNTGKLCPTGWHVPSFEEYHSLISHLARDVELADELKEKGIFPRPMLYRKSDGNFSPEKYYGKIWISEEHDSTLAVCADLDFGNNYVSGHTNNKRSGNYVLCIKD